MPATGPADPRFAVLTTPRLTLRPLALDDVDAVMEMDADPEVVRYIYGAPPEPVSHRRIFTGRIRSDWCRPGNIWTVSWTDRRGFLGWCGIFHLQDSGLMEIGYRYVRTAWGRGVATEAARKVLDHGYRALGIDPIVAVTDPDNTASQRVLEKIGLERAGMTRYYDSDVTFFRLDRAAYLARSDRAT